MAEDFLYLTTRGHKSGREHRIEIWYVEHAGRYYMVSEKRDAAHWVQNVRTTPAVRFSVGTRENQERIRSEGPAQGRLIDDHADSALAESVRAKMQARYNWSSGLIVEIAP